jgi:subtilase family serine protease
MNVFRCVGLCFAFAFVASAPAFAAVRTPAPATLRGTYFGPISPHAQFSLFVTLQGQHAGDADREIEAQNTPGSPIYGRYLTPEQYGRYFGADERDYATAIAMLRRSGFTIDDLFANRTDIEVHAPAAVVESFFVTPIDVRVENGRTFSTNRYEPSYPAGFRAVAVVGLENYVRAHPHSGHAPGMTPQSRIGKLTGWGPPDIQSAYDLTPLYPRYTGDGRTVIDATVGLVRQTDFAAFTKQFGLLSTLSQISQKNAYLDTQGESTLDVEWMAAIAPKVRVLLVTPAENTDSGFLWMYEQIVNKLSEDKIVSTSWGQCEQDIGFGSGLTSQEQLFRQAQLEGQWWMSAAGDWGTDDCEMKRGGPIAVDYPGSSKYVMSVGGTRVEPAKISHGAYNGWSDEVVWNSKGCGAGGGGQSTLFTRPSFQRGLVKSYMRQVPDVVLMADGCYLGGYLICLKGGWQNSWYGTSLAAPEWAAFLTLVEQKYGQTPITDPLYRLYGLASTKAYAKLFHNILAGRNGWYGVPGYCAQPGFSETSGLGSFVGADLHAAY